MCKAKEEPFHRQDYQKAWKMKIHLVGEEPASEKELRGGQPRVGLTLSMDPIRGCPIVDFTDSANHLESFGMEE